MLCLSDSFIGFAETAGRGSSVTKERRVAGCKLKIKIPKSHYKLQSRNSTHHHNQPCSSRSPPSELPFVQPPILTDAALLAAVGRAQLPAVNNKWKGKGKHMQNDEAATNKRSSSSSSSGAAACI